jgi:deoxyribodipyrimidine photolyase
MPLFGKNVWLECKSQLNIIDSDTYDPSCTKMTAKSRWVHWSKNRKNITIEKPQIKNCTSKEINLPIFNANINIAMNLKEEIDKVQKRLEAVIPLYHKTRNHKEGSTRLSKYLHHGVIDAASLTSGLIKILPDFIDKEHIVVPLLRQLAFREICIRKARIKNLSLENTADEWAKKLLDSKSYDNLLKELLGSFTREQFLTGTTGNKILDKTIKLGIEEKWIPNRIRMWLSSQCFYGIGGGINSLETLIDFFDMYIEDAQSPNNYVCCVEAMRMQYGKVMNYNTARSFKLINEK